MSTVTGFQVWGQWQNGKALRHHTFRSRSAAERFIERKMSKSYGEGWVMWILERQVSPDEVHRF